MLMHVRVCAYLPMLAPLQQVQMETGRVASVIEFVPSQDKADNIIFCVWYRN